MIIEAGKRYHTWGGGIATIKRVDSHASNLPYPVVGWLGGNEWVWTRQGKWDKATTSHEYDLICECTDDNLVIMVGNQYRTRDGRIAKIILDSQDNHAQPFVMIGYLRENPQNILRWDDSGKHALDPHDLDLVSIYDELLELCREVVGEQKP